MSWQNLWFNGTLVGETGINAAFVGNWGTPIALVTGDEASCREATELLGDGVRTVSVKHGIGSRGARMIPPVRARELIEAGAKEALADIDKLAAYDPGRPAEIKVEFKNTTDPAKLASRQGVEVLDARTIVSRGPDWWSAWKQFFF